MSLMKQIREFTVPQRSAAMWWFGQNGYIFKTPQGALVGVDLYLTNSCKDLHDEVNLDRKVPVLLNPEEVEVDLYACTHSHQDHADPFTIRGLRNKDAFEFLGPAQACEIFRQEKIEDSRIRLAWPTCELEFRDLKIYGMFALPTDDSDLNHMGFVFQFGNGPKIYMTGDTDFTELLYSAAKHKPDAVITCINGGFNNLSHWEAAGLMSKIKPRMAIPCHYDMFPDNSVDPLQFRAALSLQAPDVAYQQLEYGKPFVIGLD
jgi:L-ascorbate 6-phosphate lactonase